jgi:hypothetical protein
MIVAMNNQPINSDDRLLFLVEQALLSPVQRRYLMQQPAETLRKILNYVPTRQRLFEASLQTRDPNLARIARWLIISIMQNSGAIWRGTAAPEDYAEALSRTWIWFCENFHKYDYTKASFITWFNHKLSKVILDIISEPRPLPLPEYWDPPDRKPPWIEAQILSEQIVGLVSRDPGNELRNCRMRNNLNVTCQRLILAILQSQPTSPDIPWEALAHQFEVDRNCLLNFWTHTAFPCFKRFCQRNGIYNL